MGKQRNQWMLSVSPSEALAQVRAALEQMEAEVSSETEAGFTAKTPRSMRKNRYAIEWRVEVTEEDGGSKVDVEMDTPGASAPKNAKLLEAVGEQIGGSKFEFEAEETSDIEKLASTKLNIKFMVRREIKKLPSLLHVGERVVNLAQGRYERKEGLIVVTDKRILFAEEGMMRSRLEDFPYDRVSSVQTSTGVLSGEIRIFASGNESKIDSVMPKERVPEISDYVRRRLHTKDEPSAPAPVADAPGAQADPLDQLKKLGELRDAGILTPEEFEAKKAALLERF
jgi:Bacterial PH domain/Short C-terminal domain